MKLLMKNNIYIYYLCFAVISILSGVIASFSGSEILELYILLIISSFFILKFLKINDNILSLILISSLIIRIIFIIVQLSITPLPDSTTDATMFEEIGWTIAQNIQKNSSQDGLGFVYLYSYLIGIIYFLVGRIQLLPIILNTLLCLAIIIIVYKSIIEISNNLKSARIASTIVAFFPTMILYSAMTRRDMIVAFCLICSIFQFIIWMKYGRTVNILFAFFTLGIGVLFHPGIIFTSGIYIVYWCFYIPLERKWGFCFRNIILSCTITGIGYISMRDRLLEKFPRDLSLLISPEYLSSWLVRMHDGRTKYLVDLIPQSISDLIWQTPIRIYYFLCSPMIWSLQTSSDIIAFFDALLYTILAICLIVGFMKFNMGQKATKFGLLMILIVELIVFAWGTSNSGTAMRHRQKILPIIVIMAVAGITDKTKKNDLKGSASNG